MHSFLKTSTRNKRCILQEHVFKARRKGIFGKHHDFVTAVRNDGAFRRTKQMLGKSPRDKSKVLLQISRKNFKVKLISGFLMASKR